MMRADDNRNNRLMAGAAEADISPELGIQLAGAIGHRRPAEEIREPIYTRALVLESGVTRVCLITADLLAVSNQWSDRIRSSIGARLSIPAANVILHCEQNHAAPELGHCFFNTDDDHRMPRGELNWLGGGDDRYNEPCEKAIMAAVDTAAGRLRPVTLSVARGIDGRVASNRRFIMRDGTSRWHPPVCSPDILHCEGPMDPEVGVMLLTDDAGANVAAWLHHTCHPVHGYPERYVIGGWPGAWAEQMRAHLGADCMPIVINGCCGNIHHTNHVSPDPQHDHQWMAAKLTETALKTMTRLEKQESPALAIERTVLRLPTRKPEPERLAEAEKMIAEHPDPLWIDKEKGIVSTDWVLNVSLINFMETYRDDPHFDYEIQALRIADMALVGVMGEPFVEGQLKIKLHSPAPYTFVAHFCNGYAGYVPIDEAFKTGTGPKGTPELRPANGSRFAPGALDQIADAALAQLRNLF